MMWLVVVNPTSGKRKGSKLAQDLVVCSNPTISVSSL